MKSYCTIALLIFIGFVASPIVKAQTTAKDASVKVTGEVTMALELKLTDLQQFPQTEVTRKDKDGNNHTYSGVVLSAILKKAGVTSGKDLRGKNLTKYVIITASDNYQVVFALAELDKDFTDRTIILATQMNGKPLPDTDGPFRIIVQDEKKPARCVKQVTGIRVAFAQ